MVFKHFVPLIPRKVNMNDAQAQTSNQGYEEKELDLAEGVLPSGRTVLTSLTARVGSISDNNKGGYVMPIPFYRLLLRCGFFYLFRWYSYRS